MVKTWFHSDSAPIKMKDNVDAFIEKVNYENVIDIKFSACDSDYNVMIIYKESEEIKNESL